MKKIVIIQHYGGVGGSGIGLLTTIDALSDKYNVVIYCPKTPNNLLEYYKSLKLNVRSIDGPLATIPYYNGGNPIYTPSFYRSFQKLSQSKAYWNSVFERESPDLVIVNSMIMSWMADIVHENGSKIVCHVRETLPNKHSLFGLIMRHNLEKFDGVMFISEFDKKYHGLKHPKQAIIRDSLRPYSENIEINEVQTTHIWSNVLFVGGAEPIKGLDVLLQATKYIKRECTITVAGNIPNYLLDSKIPLPEKNFLINHYNKKLKGMLLNPTIKSRLHVVGHRNDITSLYEQCDVLISPSKKPHQSRPALEAGQFAKPVIAPDYKETAENIIKNYNALTFRRNSALSLAKCIDQLYKNMQFTITMGKSNYELTMRNHTYSTVLKNTLDFIDYVL
jgi:glycosyltransferase involved in cell wall biosynthesis